MATKKKKSTKARRSAKKRRPKPRTATLDTATVQCLAKMLVKAATVTRANARPPRLRLDDVDEAVTASLLMSAAVAMENTAEVLTQVLSEAHHDLTTAPSDAPTTIRVDYVDLVARLGLLGEDFRSW